LVYKPYFFNQQTIFFSHIKLANDTFSYDLSAKQTQTNRANNNNNKAFIDISSKNTSTNRACKQFVITEINKILLVIIID